MSVTEFLNEQIVELREQRAALMNQLTEKEEFRIRNLIRIIETAMINTALRRAAGNRTRAARLLGLNRTTLVEKIKRYQIEKGDWDHGKKENQQESQEVHKNSEVK